MSSSLDVCSDLLDEAGEWFVFLLRHGEAAFAPQRRFTGLPSAFTVVARRALPGGVGGAAMALRTMSSNSGRSESGDELPIVIRFWRFCGGLLGSVVPSQEISRLYRFLILVTRTEIAPGLMPLCEASARALT